MSKAKRPVQLTPEEKKQLEILKDPVRWGESHLQNPMQPAKPLKLRTYQRDIVRCRTKRKVLRMGRRCVADTDTIYTSKGPMSAKELYERYNNGEDIQIFTIDVDTFNVYPTTNFEVWFNDYVPTIEITTQSGKTQKVSKDHPFLIYTEDGPQWVEAQNIKKDMRVATITNDIIPSNFTKYSKKQDGNFLYKKQAPKEVSNIILDDLKSMGKSVRSIIGANTRIRRNTAQSKNKVLKALNNIPGSDTIINSLTGDVEWEPIVSIKESEEKTPTYDLHVPETECFIGNGIVQHNTGKTISLSVEICWKASVFKNKKILVVAAYESQVNDIFESIEKMLVHSSIMRDSVVRTKKKPHEIELDNGSLIMGMVAATSIRGKCLPEGTKVMRGSTVFEDIEKIKIGENVLSAKKFELRDQYETVKNPDWFDVDKGRVTNVIQSGQQKIFKIKTTASREIKASMDHKFFTKRRGWLELKYLRDDKNFGPHADMVGIVDTLGNFVWARIAEITYEGTAPTWDLTVEPAHCFIAYSEPPKKVSGQADLISNGGFLVHNSATDLYIDEADYVDQSLMAAEIIPIGTTLKTTSITMSSTPSGSRDTYFYKACTKSKEMGYTEFHIPSTKSPEWGPDAELTARESTTEAQYDREYLAEFGERALGVYRHTALREVMGIYSYDDLSYNRNNKYYLGVDWNDAAAGVQVVILEYVTQPFKVLLYDGGKYKTKQQRFKEIPRGLRVYKTYSLSSKEYQQLKAVDFILGLMKTMPFEHASFDYGYGATNWETLRLGIQSGMTPSGKKISIPKSMLKRMESVNFSETIHLRDPLHPDDKNKTRKVQTKNFLVRHTVKLIESESLFIPAYKLDPTPEDDMHLTSVEFDETDLLGQMRELLVDRTTPTGVEVYSKGNDHKHDALLFAVNSYIKSQDNIVYTEPKDTIKEQVSLAYPLMVSRSFMKETMPQQATGLVPLFSDNTGAITYNNWGLQTKEPPDDYGLPQNANWRGRRNGRRNTNRSVYKRR